MGKSRRMTNDDLQRDVAAELSWDPKVDRQEIVVSADAGTITMYGTVAPGSPRMTRVWLIPSRTVSSRRSSARHSSKRSTS